MPERFDFDGQLKTIESLAKEFNSALQQSVEGAPLDLAEKIKEQIDSRLSALELRLKERENSQEVSPELAKEIFGEDYLGPEAIKKAFGFEVPESEIPKIPYTREQLDLAKKTGEMLVLRVAAANDFTGAIPNINVVTIENMESIFKTADAAQLHNKERYADQHFYKSETPRAGWRLVGKHILPGSNNANYFTQTKQLRYYLESVGGLSQEEPASPSDDYINWLQDVYYNGDKSGAVKGLAELVVNKNHRRSLVEAYYDSVLRSVSSGIMLAGEKFDWTNTIEPTNSNFYWIAYTEGQFLIETADVIENSMQNVGVVGTH